MTLSNISLVGNLARAPEQICFASGRVKTVLVLAVNNLQVAKNESKNGENKAVYYRIETWGKLAELAQKYLNKGNQVTVCGRLAMEPWTDKEGHQRITPVVAATQLSFPPRLSVARKNESEMEEDDEQEETTDELFAGARAITVAEPPANYMSSQWEESFALTAS